MVSLLVLVSSASGPNVQVGWELLIERLTPIVDDEGRPSVANLDLALEGRGKPGVFCCPILGFIHGVMCEPLTSEVCG